eukprot:CAMPEP_0170234784 /NCGR_PEP_ID=MMETSP0116_2-20130129/17136_1 /TAXON_ID=400756 /ORGANISM="Durinskia baltica, Strain CSIRO CS-38" /LENGTH=64 /DNA_ID=CAMNT_0010485575 /DNA_START=113 /DNA_END=303 /DNA_ORIENTATION=-
MRQRTSTPECIKEDMKEKRQSVPWGCDTGVMSPIALSHHKGSTRRCHGETRREVAFGVLRLGMG